jgi:hypothetical protein
MKEGILKTKELGRAKLSGAYYKTEETVNLYFRNYQTSTAGAAGSSEYQVA